MINGANMSLKVNCSFRFRKKMPFRVSRPLYLMYLAKCVVSWRSSTMAGRRKRDGFRGFCFPTMEAAMMICVEVNIQVLKYLGAEPKQGVSSRLGALQ